MKLSFKSAVGSLALAALLPFAAPASAADYSATVNVSPRRHGGACPYKFTFTGVIRAERPGRVQYKFIRSDGANAPVRTINFDRPGVRRVSTTWTLGGPGMRYSGWEAIQIVYPLRVRSGRAPFTLRCAGSGGPQRPGGHGHGGKRPDLGMYGFLRLGKNKKLVKWGQTIVLTPADATLISNGPPAFEIYYSYREYDNVAVPGPFKNKVFFRGTLVSQQTNLSAGPKEIKPIHTQAYLVPQAGRLSINIDADNEVAESRENNNGPFTVTVRFSGF